MKAKIMTMLLFVTYLSGMAQTTAAEPKDSVSTRGDSLEISLLTCEPHDEVYSMYGHTALLVRDESRHFSFTVNYGVFDFESSGFLWRFIKGETDYEMGVFTMKDFMSEYVKRGTGVIEQKLNLTPEERNRMYAAMVENYKAENRKYRYNFFYDNCTTRARNMLIDHLDGIVIWPEDALSGTDQPTWREMVHRYTASAPWTRFGIDLLLGVDADQSTTLTQRQFLPFQLLDDFNNVRIERDSAVVPLVTESRVILQNATGNTDVTKIVNGGDTSPLCGGPFTPFWCFTLLSVVIVALTWWEWRRGKVLWGMDALLMALTGIVGLIPTLMLFSEHPTVGKNLQILLFNPLPLLMLWPVVRSRRHGTGHLWWRVRAVMLALFLLGALWQHYAEGLLVFGTALFIRCLMIQKKSDESREKTQDCKNKYEKSKEVRKKA